MSTTYHCIVPCATAYECHYRQLSLGEYTHLCSNELTFCDLTAEVDHFQLHRDKLKRQIKAVIKKSAPTVSNTFYSMPCFSIYLEPLNRPSACFSWCNICSK